MKIKHCIRCILMLLISLAIWQFASMNTLPLFVPSPRSVFDAGVELILSGALLKGLQYSFVRITVATLISVGLAIPISLIIYSVPFFRETIMPIASILRYVPVTAFSPLLVLWFGIDETAKVSFLVIATFVYFLPSVLLCYEEVSDDLLDTGKTMGMNLFERIFEILIPACLPSICNMLLVMYSVGWNYIAIVEATNAKYGLGYIIEVSSARGRTAVVFAAIIAIMIFSFIIDKIGNIAIRKIFKWRYVNDSVE